MNIHTKSALANHIRNCGFIGGALLCLFLFGCEEKDASPQKVQVVTEDAARYSDPLVPAEITKMALGDPALTIVTDHAAQMRIRWGINSPMFQQSAQAAVEVVKRAQSDAKQAMIAKGKMSLLPIGTLLQVQDSVSYKLEDGGYEEMYKVKVISGMLSEKAGYVSKCDTSKYIVPAENPSSTRQTDSKSTTPLNSKSDCNTTAGQDKNNPEYLSTNTTQALINKESVMIGRTSDVSAVKNNAEQDKVTETVSANAKDFPTSSGSTEKIEIATPVNSNETVSSSQQMAREQQKTKRAIWKEILATGNALLREFSQARDAREIDNVVLRTAGNYFLEFMSCFPGSAPEGVAKEDPEYQQALQILKRIDKIYHRYTPSSHLRGVPDNY